jgi:hypothetical protein
MHPFSGILCNNKNKLATKAYKMDESVKHIARLGKSA